MRISLSGLSLTGRLKPGLPPVPSAPANVAAPSISGTPQTGQTLSAVVGSWTGHPAPTFTYQWRRDAVNIAGATSATYTAIAADEGTSLSVNVTATNASGSAGATSPGVGPVAAAAASAAFSSGFSAGFAVVAAQPASPAFSSGFSAGFA